MLRSEIFYAYHEGVNVSGVLTIILKFTVYNQYIQSHVSGFVPLPTNSSLLDDCTMQ